MSFATIDPAPHRKITQHKIETLRSLLSEDDRNGLDKLFADATIPYSAVRELIRQEQPNYPDLPPELFEISADTVRNKCREYRELRGL